MSDGRQMTAAGLAALQAEVEDLEGRGRIEIAAQIKTAREWGDLKENAEYHAAKNAQAHLETRILLLRQQINDAEVVEVASGGDAVAFGSKVETLDEESGRSSTFTVVSSRDADPKQGLLSVESPVARALMGKAVGEYAEIETPRGARRLKLVSVG